MKYLFVCGKGMLKIAEIVSNAPQGAGCYNWINIFKGAVANYEKVKDKLEDYDVVQINVVPGSFGAVLDAHQRLKNSSTKLVLNNDYVQCRNFAHDNYCT